MVLQGKGVRDNILGVTSARVLCYNDTGMLLEAIVGRASIVGGAKASSVLTSNNTAPADGSTVTIGSRVYTFKTALSSGPAIANEVLINSTADAALLNLARAINLTGTIGTDYATGTLANTDVSSSASVTSHSITVTALNGGTAANALVTLASTGTASHMTWTGATMGDGTPGDALKYTFGYCMSGVAVASATTVTAVSGELNLSDAPDTDKTPTLLKTGNNSGFVLPAKSWLVVSSVAGTVGAAAGVAISIRRRYLTAQGH